MAKRKIGANLLWLLLEHLSKVLSTLTLAMIMTRGMGVEGYGAFQYTIGLVAIFSSMGFICSAEVIIPRLVASGNRKQDGQIIATAFFVRLFFCTMAAMIAVWYGLLFENINVQRILVILALAIILNEPFGAMTSWFQAKMDNGPKVRLVIFAYVAKVLIIYATYRHGTTHLQWFAIGWAMESVIISIGLALLYMKVIGLYNFRPSWHIAKELFQAGLPFFMGLIAMYLFTRMDMIALKNLANFKVVGQYAAAQQLMLGITAVAPILSISLAPSLIYSVSDKKTVRKNIAKIAAGMTCVGAFGAAAIGLISEWIVGTLFGPNFKEAANIFSWMSIASILVFLDSALNLFIIKYKLGNIAIYKWIAGVLAAAGTYVVAVPLYGAYGGVMGLTAGYLVVCIIGAFVALNKSKD